MEHSILNSTKKMLGVAPDYDAFDTDIITHINTAFSTLNQIGVGPAEGYEIWDADATWDEFLGVHISPKKLNSVRTLVFVKVRMFFDPPTTSYLLNAYEKQIAELEFRVSIEGDEWVEPIVEVVDGE